jgi:hypothetical protein
MVAGLTQVPRTILEILFGIRREFSFDQIVERIWTGTLSGGGRIALMTTAILGLLAWLNAIRIAAVGEANANRWSAVDGTISAMLVVGAFTIASLSTPSLSFMRRGSRSPADVRIAAAGASLRYG